MKPYTSVHNNLTSLRHRNPIWSHAPRLLVILLAGTMLVGLAHAQGSTPGDDPSAALTEKTSGDIKRLLPLFVVTPELRQFIAELEPLIRQKQFDPARQKLRKMIESGALAVILSDRVEDPDLLPAIEALGLQPGEVTSSEIDMGKALSAMANQSQLEESLKQERERAEGALEDLSYTEKERNALKDQLDRTTNSVSTLKAELEHANDLMEQERARAEAANRELATVSKEIESLKAAQVPAAAPPVFQFDVRELPASGGEAWEKLASLGQVIPLPSQALPLPGPVSEPPAQPESPTPVTSRPAEPVPPVEKAPTPSTSEADHRMLARADTLLEAGDVSGARLILERLQQTGNGRAIFKLAETYDPRVLSRIKAFGIRGDPAKARELYEQALASGIEEARGNLAALR